MGVLQSTCCEEECGAAVDPSSAVVVVEPALEWDDLLAQAALERTLTVESDDNHAFDHLVGAGIQTATDLFFDTEKHRLASQATRVARRERTPEWLQISPPLATELLWRKLLEKNGSRLDVAVRKKDESVKSAVSSLGFKLSVQDYLKVIAVKPDSHADILGIQPGWTIASIEGENVVGKDLQYIAEKLMSLSEHSTNLTEVPHMVVEFQSVFGEIHRLAFTERPIGLIFNIRVGPSTSVLPNVPPCHGDLDDSEGTADASDNPTWTKVCAEVDDRCKAAGKSDALEHTRVQHAELPEQAERERALALLEAELADKEAQLLALEACSDLDLVFGRRADEPDDAEIVLREEVSGFDAGRQPPAKLAQSNIANNHQALQQSSFGGA